MRRGDQPTWGDETTAVAGAVGLSAVVGSVVALAPRFLAPLAGVALVSFLVVCSPIVFVGAALLGRNLASGRADLAVAGPLNAGAAVGLLVIGIAGLRLLRVQRPRLVGAAFLVLFAFGAWSAVAYANFGNDPTVMRELVRLASVVALGLVVANLPLDTSPRTVALVVAGATVPSALLGLVQLVTRQTFVDPNCGAEFAHVCQPIDRVWGTFSHPNEASTIFALSLGIVVWAFLRYGPSTLLWMLAGLLSIVLLGTKSMGGIAQAIATLVVFALATPTRPGFQRRVQPAMVVLAAVALIVAFALTPIGSDRIAELSSTASPAEASQGLQYTTNSIDWRFYNWAKLLEAWQEQPYLGYGSGTTNSLVLPGGNIPHNDFIRLLVETGMVGWILFVTLFVVVVVRLRHLSRESGREFFPELVLATVVGYAVHALVDNVWNQTASIYALAVLVVYAIVVQRPSDAAR